LFENEFLHIVAISFTALILNELSMVALEITTWCVNSLLRFVHAHEFHKAYIHGHLRNRNVNRLHRQHGFPTRIFR
jgi:hypothetical protein